MTNPLIEENLKKLVHGWGNDFSFLSFESIAEISEKSLPGFSVSKEHLEFLTSFDARDMAWNHMDFTHRPWIHKHYADGLRTVLGKNISFGFTPWSKTPLLIPTFDLRVSDREFLHGYNLAGLVHVFMKICILPQSTGENIWSLDWFVLSKKYLRFLHYFIHRSMKKMNTKLFEEDHPVKMRRKNLRSRGYSFINDELDFYSSTTLFPNNIRRPAASDLKISLTSVPLNQKTVFRTKEREFLIFRTDEKNILIWDNVCSHQGGNLNEGNICENFVTCPWHGLQFAGTLLSQDQPVRENVAFGASIKDGFLTISPKI